MRRTIEDLDECMRGVSLRTQKDSRNDGKHRSPIRRNDFIGPSFKEGFLLPASVIDLGFPLGFESLCQRSSNQQNSRKQEREKETYSPLPSIILGSTLHSRSILWLGQTIDLPGFGIARSGDSAEDIGLLTLKVLDK
jgi:hypothetical protein